jgi:hypothetical protein
MPKENPAMSTNTSRRLLIAVIIIGLALQILLYARSWIRGDQLILFALGQDFVNTGQLEPVAKKMSGGGSIPGCLLQLLVAIPLKIWPYFKSPYLMVGLIHIAALMVLFFTLKEARGLRFTALFLAVYWLSPWRLYHSGFLWEPSFLVLPGALHLWACWKLKDRSYLFPSAVLVAILLLAGQIHGSFFILVMLSILLFFRKLIHIDWRGALLGAIVGILPLLPLVSALLSGQPLPVLPQKNFIGYGLLRIHPILKAILYWFRVGSLDIGQRLRAILFLQPEWVHGYPARWALFAGLQVLHVLSLLSVFLSIIATVWYFRRDGKKALSKNPAAMWIRSYAINCFVALGAAAALSPVTMQGWYMVILLHAACIPLTDWILTNWTAMKRWARWAIVLFIVLRIPITLVIGLGHGMYRMQPIPDPQRSGFRRIVEYLPADVLKELDDPAEGCPSNNPHQNPFKNLP